MNIARLSIGYGRGVARNEAQDVKAHLGLFDVTEAKVAAVKKAKKAEQGPDTDGPILRGLGTHFISKEESELVKLRDANAKALYTSWRETFLSTPLDGVYVIPQPGAAKAWLREQEYRSDMTVRVSEFELTTRNEMDAADIMEWTKRIKNQLSAVSLGRGKDGDAKGLSALAALSSCPLLSKATAQRIKELVEMARDGKMDRVELKRQIITTNIEIDQKPITVRRNIKLDSAEPSGTR
jgi:hypothetical protein